MQFDTGATKASRICEARLKRGNPESASESSLEEGTAWGGCSVLLAVQFLTSTLEAVSARRAEVD